jgi:SAM-dependent methyltransferase
MTNHDISHYDGLRYWGPLSEQRMERLIDLVDLPAGAQALDVGCGRGELLLRLIERYGVEATGLDCSRSALDLLQREAAARVPKATLRAVEGDVAEFAPPGRYAFISWLGGPLLGEGLGSSLATLAGWLAPSGYLLMGAGFWNSEPPAAYLEATGIGRDELADHLGNIEAGEVLGLRQMYCCVANRDEWDGFESRILCNVEQYAIAHPDAPDPTGRLAQRRAFHGAQQRWGRDVMGFGLYLFRDPTLYRS